jgi:hypothetical protein
MEMFEWIESNVPEFGRRADGTPTKTALDFQTVLKSIGQEKVRTYLVASFLFATSIDRYAAFVSFMTNGRESRKLCELARALHTSSECKTAVSSLLWHVARVEHAMDHARLCAEMLVPYYISPVASGLLILATQRDRERRREVYCSLPSSALTRTFSEYETHTTNIRVDDFACAHVLTHTTHSKYDTPSETAFATNVWPDGRVPTDVGRAALAFGARRQRYWTWGADAYLRAVDFRQRSGWRYAAADLVTVVLRG